MNSKRFAIYLSAGIVIILTIAAVTFLSLKDHGSNNSADTGLKIRVKLFDASEAYTESQLLPGDKENVYALFLPSDCDRSNLRITFDHKQLYIDDELIKSGETTSVFEKDRTVKVRTNTDVYSLKICSSENLPSVFITTKSGSLSAIHEDKSHKEKATLTIAEGGKVLLKNSALSYIKGRGNISWTLNEKRSYNIKFEEKTDILGMSAAKKWALISNNRDKTLIRNAIVYTAAQMTDLPYTVDFRFADLYINGNYRGNYIICEKIEVGKNRIDINDLEKDNEEANPKINLDDAKCVLEERDGMHLKYWTLPEEPADITGGFLLEYDTDEAYETEKSVFSSKNNKCLNIHSPEHVSQNEINYLSTLYDEFEQALLSADGKNAANRSFFDYIDTASFVDAAVISEFTLERDRGAESWYIFLPEDSGKFYAGPAWDFDVSMDSATAVPDSVYFAAQKLALNADELKEATEDWRANVLLNLLSNREFVSLLSKRVLELCDVFENQLNDRVEKMFDTISSSAECDMLRWGYEVSDEFDIQLRTYIPERVKYLRECFEDFDAAAEAESNNIK